LNTNVSFGREAKLGQSLIFPAAFAAFHLFFAATEIPTRVAANSDSGCAEVRVFTFPQAEQLCFHCIELRFGQNPLHFQ
jgi:hypothetical protein